MELISNNKPELVESVTRKGLEALPNLEKSIKILTQLQGVGPATASGIGVNHVQHCVIDVILYT